MQQFGGTTSPRSMIPGKRIPARPFLGISDSDETMILKTVNDYFRGVID
jgi:phage gpG-like protein